METVGRKRRKVQVIFTRKMEERKLFMQELKQYRHHGTLRAYRKILKSVGPKWYQVLSTTQIHRLHTLRPCIHQDLLQGTTTRTMEIMINLGIYPAPNPKDLFNCMIVGRHDPKEFLAEYYCLLYEYPINRLMHKYPRNGKLICSAIYTLGLKEMMHFLEEKYKPDPPPPPPKPKPKRKIKKAKSPYLAPAITAKPFEPHKPKRLPPPPMPKDLSALNEPYVEEPPVPKRIPPPPPPPPPKKRLTVAYCGKWSDYVPSQFRSLYDYDYDFYQSNYIPPVIPAKKPRAKSIVPEDYTLIKKKSQVKYGIDTGKGKKKKRKPKLLRPNLPNEQFLIQGVHYCQGRNIFIVGNLVRLPDAGNLHHGGTAIIKNNFVKIHKGVVGRSIRQDEGRSDCDCFKNYRNKVFKHLQQTKCLCGHRYDFKNEGSFSEDQDPYFEGASRYGGYQFNYDQIYDNQSKAFLEVKRLAKEIWETDSNLKDPNEGTEFKKKKMIKRDTKTVLDVIHCLPENPKIEDYLRCALRYLRKTNAAARLPDLHQASELREWMRHRLYGPLSEEQKKRYMFLSTQYWTYLDILQKRGFCKPVKMSKYVKFNKDATWTEKDSLHRKFMKTIEECKQRTLKSHLHLNNVLWATMYTAKFPDKHFRDIFFAYQIYQPSHITILNPYDVDAIMKLRSIKLARPYKCPLKMLDVSALE